MLNQLGLKRLTTFLFACLLAGLLAACGGGGTNDGCLNIDPSRSPALPGCGGSTTSPGGGTSTVTAMTLGLTDASGNPISAITPESPGTLKALIKDAQNKAIPNVPVTFSTSDDTAVWSPSSGTALTDSNGVAKIGIASGSKAGGFTAKATAVVGTSNLSATAGYAVSFPTLTLSDLRITPSPLPAGANASVSVTVMSGSTPYTPAMSVAFSSPCSKAGKAVIGSPVVTQSGIAVASYTDKGCGTADAIVATVVTPAATLSKTGTITVLPPSAGSLKFVGVDNANIALVGTGGPGRVEFSNVKFQVFDASGNPLIGKQIDFTFGDTAGQVATVGGLTLYPTSATSDNLGMVSTLVSNGTIPTSIRVIATVNGSNPILTTISSILVVSTGIPDQRHFTIRPVIGNCEGRDWVRECTQLEAYVADHFSNPVPDGTAVNFTTESGMIDASCLTVAGHCTAKLFSSSTKKIDGRLTILAYAVGEETLLDNNGNNVYDPGETFDDMSPDIFRDDNENGKWDSGEPCVGPNSNGTCSTPGDGQYNGVLRRPQVKSAQTLYVSNQYTQIFSGSDAFFEGPASLTCSINGSTSAAIKVFDIVRNLMPAGSSIAFSVKFASGAGAVDPNGETVRNVVHSIGMVAPIPTYSVAISCPNVATSGTLKIVVTTPLGIVTNLAIPITVN